MGRQQRTGANRDKKRKIMREKLVCACVCARVCVNVRLRMCECDLM